jgi:hypothetical protein
MATGSIPVAGGARRGEAAWLTSGDAEVGNLISISL